MSIRSLLGLVAIGIFLVALFLFQITSIARTDFYVAHHFGHLTSRLAFLAYGASAAFIGLWLVLRGMRTYSPRMLPIVVIIVAAILAALAIITHPTRSQDIYWSLLLGKGFSHLGLNPYTTVPVVLADDPWAYPVLTWKDIPMIYGPLWTILVALATWFTDTLGTALMSMKILFAAAWALCGLVLWKITAVLGYEKRTRAVLAVFFLWNPFILQAALVDLHNDLFLMLSFLASYYFLLKRRYGLSMIALLFGGFIKYVPWMFLVIPAYYLIRDRTQGVRRYWVLAAVAALGGIAAWLLYLPFGGIGVHSFSGFSNQIENVGMASQFLPGATVLAYVFDLNFAQLRWAGIIGAFAMMIWCLRRDKPLLAYTLPVIVMLFFGTPWFQPWYGLWVLPLMMLYLPMWSMAVVSGFLLITPELVAPAVAAISLPASAAYVYSLAYFYRYVKR